MLVSKPSDVELLHLNFNLNNSPKALSPIHLSFGEAGTAFLGSFG
ncbi:hypothetical protein CJ739_3715 [Mariniflexile rhizosphaerae]|nr:hypothetical protein CJ739_3715 [Mariniflexile sp. TRM1-10]